MSDVVEQTVKEDLGSGDAVNVKPKEDPVQVKPTEDHAKLSRWIGLLLSAVWVVVGGMLIVASLMKEESDKATIKSILTAAMGMLILATAFAAVYYMIGTERKWYSYLIVFVFLGLAVFTSILTFGHGEKLYNDMKDKSVILITGISMATLGLGFIAMKLRKT